MKFMQRLTLVVLVGLLTTFGVTSNAEAARRVPLTSDQIQEIVTTLQSEIQAAVTQITIDSAAFQQELNAIALELFQSGTQPNPAQIQKFAQKIQKVVLKNQKNFVKSVTKLTKASLKKLKREDLEPEVLQQIAQVQAQAVAASEGIAAQIQQQLQGLFGGGGSGYPF